MPWALTKSSGVDVTNQVFVPAKDEAADGLAAMFGGDGEKEEE